MDDHSLPISQLASERLHEGRRSGVFERFMARVEADMGLSVHRVQEEQVDAWRAIYQRIFNAVYDRYDVLRQGSEEEFGQHQKLYQERLKQIFDDLRPLGMAGTLAGNEISMVQEHAYHETRAIHATPDQRIKLHRAQIQDAGGRWRNPGGRFVHHYEKGDHRATIEDIIGGATEYALGFKQRTGKYGRLYELMDQQWQQQFWRQSESLKSLITYSKEPQAPRLTEIVYAVSMALAEEHEQLPVPNIITPPKGAAEPQAVIAALKSAGLYETAVKNVLYRQLQAGLKDALGGELQANYPDPALLGERSQYDEFATGVAHRLQPYREVCFDIAQKHLEPLAMENFEKGFAEIKRNTQQAFSAYVTECKANGVGGSAAR